MVCQGRLWVLKGELDLPERAGGRWKEGGSSWWVGHAEGWSRATERTNDVQGAGRRPLGMMKLASVRSLQGLVASRHVESSWTRDQTCLLCVGRWIHWTTREVQEHYFLRLSTDVVIVRVFAGPVTLIVGKGSVVSMRLRKPMLYVSR